MPKPNNPNVNRRTQKLINPRFQITFILYNLATAGLVTMILYFSGSFFPLALGASTVLIFLHGLLLSHKIAGPVHKLQRHMMKTSQGFQPGPIRFREKDFFPELADAYNRELEFWQKREREKKSA